MKCPSIKVALAFFLMLVLAACSSTGTIMMQQAKNAPIPPGKTVSLSVEPVIPDKASNDQIAEFREVGQRVKAALFGRLVSEGVFKQVLQPAEVGDYRMRGPSLLPFGLRRQFQAVEETCSTMTTVAVTDTGGWKLSHQGRLK